MAIIEPIVRTNELRTDRLARILKQRTSQLHFNWDKDLDTFMLMFVSPETPTIVHYVDDDDVALLVEPDELEVVGLQIERFRANFMPRHANVAHVWRLSDTGIRMREFSDLLLALEEVQFDVAKEIFKATRDDFRNWDVPLAIPELA